MVQNHYILFFYISSMADFRNHTRIKKQKRLYWIKKGRSKVPVRFQVRSRKEMGDYIALNWLELKRHILGIGDAVL